MTNMPAQQVNRLSRQQKASRGAVTVIAICCRCVKSETIPLVSGNFVLLLKRKIAKKIKHQKTRAGKRVETSTQRSLLRLEDVVLAYFKYGSNKCFMEVVMGIKVL